MENHLDFVSKCIDLAVNTIESRMVDKVDSRCLGEPGYVFSRDKIEISSVSSPENTSYVLVKYDGETVLKAEYIDGEGVELADETIEWQEDWVEIGFIKPGEWENIITGLYRSYFKE